ncbi:MAG: T9SS type A sorting domain-containing protein [Bacteroidota bacterium]
MKKFLFIPILICHCFCAHSQVYNAGTMFAHHQDINPDTLVNYTVVPFTNETYGIMLFGDVLNSIEFTARGAVSSGGSAAYLNVNAINTNIHFCYSRLDSVYVPSDTSWNVTKIAKPLNAGEQLDTSTLLWDSTTVYFTDHSGSGGGNKNVNDWIGLDKYLGMKYINGNNVAYGWVKVHCVSEDSIYIKEFSFSEIVSEISGIKEISQNETMLYPNPINTYFYLDGINDFTSIKLTDLYGKEIKFNSEIHNSKIRIEPAQLLPNGYYLLQYIQKNGKPFSGKLIKINE